MALKVLFIGGYTRSGSTVLSRVLGRIEGFCDVGELRNVWKKGLERREPCGCGRDFGDCEFWAEVFGHAFGGLDRVDPREMLSLRQTTEEGSRPWPLGLFATIDAERPELRKYGEALARVLTAVQRVTDCRVVVDSSKTAAHGAALSTSPEVELHVLHLVRDARATAFSWQRVKERPGPSGDMSQMHRHGYLTSARHWRRANRTVESLRDAARTFATLRYEDFVRDPRAHCGEILERLGEHAAPDALPDGRVVELVPTHTIGGNPNRFQTGQIEIRADDQWRREMSRWGKGVVTATAWRMLKRYGYLDAG